MAASGSSYSRNTRAAMWEFVVAMEALVLLLSGGWAVAADTWTPLLSALVGVPVGLGITALLMRRI